MILKVKFPWHTFGIPSNLIDHNAVIRAAEKAQISDTIDSLNKGYNTLVGERGIQLSGGQKQRIGIARALYKNSSLIIFDEATSSLDIKTEMDVMRAIDSIKQDITIILVAHRLTTLQNCDKVYQITQGKIIHLENFSSKYT